MSFGAVASAVGGSLVSGLMGGGKQQQQQSSSEPWGPQQQYLKDGFAGAQTALTNAQGMGTYQGPYTAGMNPLQAQGLNQTAQFAQGSGMDGANAMFGSGMGMLGAGNQFANNAQGMFGQLNGADPTQQIMGNANAYAANPYIDGMVDAASRDVTRNLNEQQLPGLDLSAAASGNMDSTRTGVAQGIMQRGAADRIGDISAQLHGAAFNNGLGMAQSQYNTGIGQTMAANGQLAQAGQMGQTGINNGLNAGYGAGDALTRAGTGFTTFDQNAINGQRQQFTDQQNQPLDLLGKYMGIINGSYGGSSQSSTQGNAGQSAVSGALGGLGLFNKLGGAPSQGLFSGNSTDPFANSNSDQFNLIAKPDNYG